VARAASRGRDTCEARSFRRGRMRIVSSPMWSAPAATAQVGVKQADSVLRERRRHAGEATSSAAPA
jgi:hypothetical protein